MGKWQNAANELASVNQALITQALTSQSRYQAQLEAEWAKVPTIDAMVQEFITSMRQVRNPGLENVTSTGSDGFGKQGETFRAWVVRYGGIAMAVQAHGKWAYNEFSRYGRNRDGSDCYGVVSQFTVGRSGNELFFHYKPGTHYRLDPEKIRSELVLKLQEHGAPLPCS